MKATFGAGCFWCAEAAYQLLEGVESVVPGYAGGREKHPSYENVSEGKTGHVEAVQIEYNPEKVSYEDLLKVFWEIHDPTQENRQGPDVGPQYQAAIFWHTEEQKRLAEQSKEVTEKRLGMRAATKVLPFTSFYGAEEYHRNYYRKHPEQPYSQQIIAPKVEKVKKIKELL